MSIQSGLARVLTEYPAAQSRLFKGDALAHFLRKELRDTIQASAPPNEDLVYKGSAGQGRWAFGPWVGIFDKNITSGAQAGFYPCYLFREDMQGVYLSLNQGVTEVKKFFKSSAKDVLRARARMYRDVLGSKVVPFGHYEIDLAPSASDNDTAFYQAGNICSAFYPADRLPAEDSLVQDLRSMILLYGELVRINSVIGDNVDISDAPPQMMQEDVTRFRAHKRIERRASVAKKVKDAKGYRCEVCNLSFDERYGKIGQNFIEAHHLKPLSELKGQVVDVDPLKDFAVLCSNCHRMVHRSGVLADIEQFKREHFNVKKP